MPNVRPLNEKKYEISKHRFLEVYHHCLQYPEWQKELKYETDTVKSIKYGTVGKARKPGSVTENLAIRREKIREKCKLIEKTALEAAPGIYLELLEGVTTEYASYRFLHDVRKIPCGKDMYYECRRKFYWLMSKKI